MMSEYVPRIKIPEELVVSHAMQREKINLSERKTIVNIVAFAPTFAARSTIMTVPRPPNSKSTPNFYKPEPNGGPDSRCSTIGSSSSSSSRYPRTNPLLFPPTHRIYQFLGAVWLVVPVSKHLTRTHDDH